MLLFLVLCLILDHPCSSLLLFVFFLLEYPTGGTKSCQIVHLKLLACTSGTQVLSTYTISHVVRREVENCRNEAINKNLFSTPVRHYGAQTWHFPLTCNFYAVRAKVHL